MKLPPALYFLIKCWFSRTHPHTVADFHALSRPGFGFSGGCGGVDHFGEGVERRLLLTLFPKPHHLPTGINTEGSGEFLKGFLADVANSDFGNGLFHGFYRLMMFNLSFLAPKSMLITLIEEQLNASQVKLL